MKTDKHRWVYYVFDVDGVVKYVGCSVDPKGRIRQHLWEAKNSLAYVRRLASRGIKSGILCSLALWLLEQDRLGRPYHVCAVQLAGPNWAADEQAEITRLCDGGVRLLNRRIANPAEPPVPIRRPGRLKIRVADLLK